MYSFRGTYLPERYPIPSSSPPTTQPSSSSTDQQRQVDRIENAVCTIQRAYRMYRLRCLIRDLQTTEPWFFRWKTCCSETPCAALSVTNLQRKFSDENFFRKITQFFQLLGQRVDASSKCHAKLLLIGFMMNHHANQDVPLAKHIQCLGTAFLSVCEEPDCWFKRIGFFYAYSCFYRGFLDSKCRNAAVKIPKVLDNLTRGLIMCNMLSKHHNPSLVQRTLNYLQARTQDYMVVLTELVGSSSKAAELVRQDMARKMFVQNLQKLTNSFDKSQCDPNDKSRQYRSVGLQLVLDQKFLSVHLNSREAKYDCSKHSTSSVMRDCYRMKLDFIKQLIRFNYNSNKQSDWLPCFLGHVQMVLSTLSQDVSIDNECVKLQCARNCYNPSRMITYLLSVMKTIFMPNVSGRCYDNLIGDLEAKFNQEGCSKAVLFTLLDILDDLRVDHMDHYFQLNCEKLTVMSRRRELRYFVQDLNSQRISVKNLINWIVLSRNDQTRSSSSSDNVEALRLNQLRITFAHMMTSFPSPFNLDNFPETFKLMRLTILRTLILVKDTVMAFTIIQFIITLSGDSSHIFRIKQGILAILNNECNTAQSEMVNQLFGLIQTERPCLSDRDQKILKGLINRVIRKPDVTTTEEVPKLALHRIQLAIQHNLLTDHPGDDTASGPKLAHFEQEVATIAANCRCILDLSFEIYKPIYHTLLHFNEIWDE